MESEKPDIDPNDVRSLRWLANLGNEDKESFDKDIEKDLAINPKETSALYYKGVMLCELGSYTEAIEYFDKVLAIIDPKDNYYLYLALFYKGIILSELGSHTEAIEYFDKALAFSPDNVGILANKAMSLKRLGKYNEAIECYDKALAEKKRPPDLRSYRSEKQPDLY